MLEWIVECRIALVHMNSLCIRLACLAVVYRTFVFNLGEFFHPAASKRECSEYGLSFIVVFDWVHVVICGHEDKPRQVCLVFHVIVAVEKFVPGGRATDAAIPHPQLSSEFVAALATWK